MSLRVAGVIATLIILFGCAVTVWVFAQPRGTTAGRLATPTSESERAKQPERYFGGDPNRDIRSGQEMKPRW